MNLEYAILGLAVGILVGMTGVGGGSLVTPVLTLFGVPTVTAVGTDLAFAAVTKTFGTIVHRAQASVEWRIVFLLAAGSCPAALVTIAALSAAGIAGKTGFITNALATALICTAASLVVDRRRMVRFVENYGGWLHNHNGLATIIAGIVLGSLVTLSSVGAGALGATFLVALHPRLSVVRIAGTDIAHAVPLTIIGGVGHAWLGTVNVPLLGSLLLGSIPGIILGSLLAARAPERVVRLMLATILLFAGLRFIAL